jgi:glycosyltransferase involved in cell wall biosynthesis
MIKNKKVTLCLPCRNEGTHLKEVVKHVPKEVDEIIIISNNSKDNTVEIAKKLGGRVKVIEDNRTIGGIGYGFAHMSGIAAAKGDIIAGADGDATYPIEDINKIASYLMDNDFDFISCSRYPIQDGTKIPLKLQLGVNLLNWEIRLLYGVKITDALSGMWVFKKDIRDQLKLTMGEWNLSPQIKLNAATNPKIKYGEYSIKQHQRLGETKQDYFKTGFAHASWILANRFSSPSPKSHDSI